MKTKLNALHWIARFSSGRASFASPGSTPVMALRPDGAKRVMADQEGDVSANARFAIDALASKIRDMIEGSKT